MGIVMGIREHTPTAVVGLYRALGDADNARNRLKTQALLFCEATGAESTQGDRTAAALQAEGARHFSTGPRSSTFWQLRHDYVSCIRNEETVLKVQGLTGDAMESVTRMLWFVDPSG